MDIGPKSMISGIVSQEPLIMSSHLFKSETPRDPLLTHFRCQKLSILVKSGSFSYKNIYKIRQFLDDILQNFDVIQDTVF